MASADAQAISFVVWWLMSLSGLVMTFENPYILEGVGGPSND